MTKNKILIADRESPFILQAIDTLMSVYELSVAYSKNDVFYKIQNEYPDLIIIGLLKERGDSFSVHRELRENINTKHIPILIIDAKPEDRIKKGWNRYEGDQMDADGYMCRPVEPAKLKAEVERIIFLTSQKNKEFSKALKLTELILLNQVANWKKKMIQMVGVNRIPNS